MLESLRKAVSESGLATLAASSPNLFVAPMSFACLACEVACLNGGMAVA